MFFDKFTVSFAPLNLLKEKEQGMITRLKFSDDFSLAQLEALGIIPGLAITLEQKFPDFVISVEENLLKINENLAEAIVVKTIL